MSYTYSGDPSVSVRDEVRFLIGDTDESCAELSDVELDYLIGKWEPLYGSALYIASVAAATIARKYARVVDVSAGGTSASVGQLQQRFTEMALRLRHEYEAEGDVGGLVDLDNILVGAEYDSSIEPLEFAMRLDDNPRAGRQNYGGFISGRDPDWVSR